MQNPQSQKVFILGFDGATYSIIKPMIERGQLPALARLLREGAHGELNSTVLSNSAPAWTSFATGKDPGKHGISGFFRLVPNSYELALVNGSDNKARTLWEAVGAHGKKSIVMNIPMTYPPKRINGLLVSGLDAPDLSSDFTHPPELKQELLRVVPDYKINLHLGGYLHNDRRRRKAIQVMLDCIRARERAVLHLMNNHAWDLFVVRFNSPDNVQHQFWRYMDASHPSHDPRSSDELKDAIRTVYQELDRVLASITSQLPDDCTLIVMSDHGAGPRSDKTVRLNQWLHSLGYLTSKVTQKRRRKYTYRAVEKMVSFFLKRVPPGLKQWVMKVFPNAVSKTWTYFRFPNIDWTQTRAFVAETEGIRINREDKCPSGIVKAEEYEQLRDDIIRQASELRDPDTGDPVFERVAKAEELFQGPHLAQFPDIIALTMKDQYNISIKLSQKARADGDDGSLIGREEHWRKVSGSHRREGVLLLHGSPVRPNAQLEPAEIVDLLPTTVHLLGLPVPSDVDGKVITRAFTDEYLGSNPVRSEAPGTDDKRSGGDQAEYTGEEKEELVDHLRGLGYVE